LNVNVIEMAFSGASKASGNADILLNKGTILQSGRLDVGAAGLTMNGGQLTVGPGLVRTYGNLNIHGGTVKIGTDAATGEFDVLQGAVVMDGGTFIAKVDATKLTNDLWTASGGFTLGGTSTLTMSLINKAERLAPGTVFEVLKATGTTSTITKDFATKNLAIDDGSGNDYMDLFMSGNAVYDLKVP
jgi:hypothetical protein